jgi:DNA-binding CsgD family transcriptional regulator
MEVSSEPRTAAMHRLKDAVAMVAGAMASDRMEPALANAANTLARIDRLYAFEHRGHQSEPVLYRYWTKIGALEELVARYRERYYKADPISAVLDRLHSSDCAATVRVRSQDVSDPDYRKTWLVQPEICERISVMRRVDKKWLVLNCARSRRAGAFSRDEIALIDLFGSLTLPLIARHEILFDTIDLSRKSTLSIQALEHRFGRLLTTLTQREREVCARTVIGMTAEAIAIDLSIGRASVLTYRRRAYRRLNICSTYQLSTLVLR